MYTLTEDDTLLLAHLAGGFNYNRVGVPYSDRFNASVKWTNADALNKLVESLTAQPAPVPPSSGTSVGTLFPGATSAWFGANSSQVYSALAGADGNFTFTVGSGSDPCWASVDPAFPDDESKTSYGSGVTNPLSVKAGQVIYMRQDGAEAKNARCSLG